MSTFKIIKKGANNFWHWYNGDAKKVAISDFEVVLEEVSQTFLIVYKNGANVPQQAVSILDIEVIDETDASLVETFTNVVDLRTMLVELGYTAYLSATGIQSVVAGTNVAIDNTDPANPIISATGGGGGGAVDSVNGQTGIVVLDTDDISDSSTTNKFVTSAEKTAITHSNRSILDAITESFTTALKSAYDGAKNNIDALLLTGSRLITSAEITKLSNTSGTNTGDNATNTTSNAYADAKVADAINDGTTTIAPSQNAVFDALATKQDVLTDVNFGSFSNGLTAKTTVVDADSANIVDSADSNKSKKTSLLIFWTNYIKPKVDSLLVSFKTANFLDFTSSGQTQLNNKVGKTNWIDISLTSTIVGFSDFTTRIIRYKQISDNVIWVKGDLSGTSNSAFLNFTIPFTSANNAQTLGIAGVVSGTSQQVPAFAVSNPNSNVVNIFRDFNAQGFATSGNKTGKFSILIEVQ